MKRLMFFFILSFYLFSFQPTTFAAGSISGGEPSVYDTIHKDKKNPSPQKAKTVDSHSPSIFPLFMKFIFSFVLVIGLLIVLLRFLSKRNRLLQSNGPVLSLGGHGLGNNRSLQVLLIGQTIYIIGVGETISLIRTISQGEEYHHLLESIESQAEGNSAKWFSKDSKIKWNTVFTKHLLNMKQENGEE